MQGQSTGLPKYFLTSVDNSKMTGARLLKLYGEASVEWERKKCSSRYFRPPQVEWIEKV
jgi:hypothetical protein